MKMKEVVQKTGLTEKTIRYYEEKELIIPEISMVGKRRFREYTEQNVKELEEIANLRRLYFSIEEIKTMKENASQIPKIMEEYKDRMEKELEVKLQITSSLQSMELSENETIETVIHKIAPKTEKFPLPKEDINPDFKRLDRQNSRLNLLVDRRIYTRHGIFARRISEVEVLIMLMVEKKNQMSYNDVLHACRERGIKDQKYVNRVIKKMCLKRLLRTENGMYSVEADMPKLSPSKMDRLVQGAVVGSPNLFVYTPQAPMSVSSKGYGPF